jgi:hypothetical protein
MTRNRAIVAFGISLFLILAGTGTASALWSSLSNANTTVTAATMGISQTGFEALAVEYGATVSSEVAPVTVTNTGAIASTFTLSMKGPESNPINSAATVQTMTVGSAAACTSSTSFTSTSYKWSTLPNLTGTLAAGASAFYCVKSTLNTTQNPGTAGQSLDVTLTLTSASTTTGDSWVASAKAVASQTAKDTSAPSAPGIPTFANTSGYSTSISWAASSDNVGVASYDLYRGTTLVKSGVTSPYVDATLTNNTPYSYTVRAVDVAGNTSSSPAASVRTLNVSSSIWLSVKSASSTNKCVDVDRESTRSGSGLYYATCDSGASQAWNFSAVGDGTYRVIPAHAMGTSWAVPQNAGGYAQIVTWDNAATSKWTVRPVGTSGTQFQFVNVSTQTCLTGNASQNGALYSANCVSPATSSQIFTLTAAR